MRKRTRNRCPQRCILRCHSCELSAQLPHLARTRRETRLTTSGGLNALLLKALLLVVLMKALLLLKALQLKALRSKALRLVRKPVALSVALKPLRVCGCVHLLMAAPLAG